MDWIEAGLFALAGLALLGSPGPGIAALVAVGRAFGFRGGLRFYVGLQIGLALAAAIAAGGFLAVIEFFPGLRIAMSAVAVIYLLFVAWQVATAPVGTERRDEGRAASLLHGLGLGLSNPKAYAAFISLFASFRIVETGGHADSLAKWVVLVAIMVAVDLAWLMAGVLLGRVTLSHRQERALNAALAASIVVATALAFI